MKQKSPIFEKITRVPIGQSYIARIWSTLPELDAYSKFDEQRLRNLATDLAVDPHLLPSTIVRAFLALPETAAVEVLTPYGAGIVAYAEWP